MQFLGTMLVDHLAHELFCNDVVQYSSMGQQFQGEMLSHTCPGMNVPVHVHVSQQINNIIKAKSSVLNEYSDVGL